MVKKRGAVFTVITNGKNKLLEQPKSNYWDYFCFTDNVSIVGPKSCWTPIKLACPGLTSRRCSKVPKILAHRYLEEYEYSLYIDGTLQLKQDPTLLLEHLKGNNIALFEHNTRSCIYDEAKVVLSQRRDNKDDVDRTISFYKSEKYPKNNGLVDTKLILRRHCDAIKILNETWWNIFNTYSQRDQLSFNYASWKTDIAYSIIPGNPYKDSNLYVKKHAHARSAAATDGLTETKNPKIMEKILEQYNSKVSKKSDINEHLPTLKKYAEECDHVTELGCRGVVSTWAFLAGKPSKMVSVDIEPSPIEEASKLATQYGIDFTFIHQDDLKIKLEKTDLLFIDTLHTYDQLSQELTLHGNKAKKYIIMHDTEVFGHLDYYGNKKYGREGKVGLKPAIEEFLTKNKAWTLEKEYTNNNGLTVLKRVSTRKKRTEE